MSIQKKSVLIGLAIATATATLFVSAAWWQSSQFAERASREAERLADSDQEHIAGGILQLVKTQDELLVKSVESSMEVFRHLLKTQGEVTLGQPESWKATNQFTKDQSEVVLPRLLIGGLWLGHTQAAAQRVPLVDEVTRLTGGPATVFQRINAEGDMLRVATSVLDKKGSRAIGTYIPHRMADGKVNPVIERILSKQRFVGAAFVVDAWYVTAYDPIVDASGKVIGMIFTGHKQESVPSLRKALETAEVGQRGYVQVIGTAGDSRGKVLVSREGRQDGMDILGEKDADGREYAKQIVEQAAKLEPGQIGTIDYVVLVNGKRETVEARFSNYKPWNWVIVTHGFKSDFHGFMNSVEEGRLQMTRTLVLLGLLAAGLAAVVYAWFARKLSQPIRKLVSAAETISQGDLSEFEPIRSKDEIGQLGDAFAKMRTSLREVADVAKEVGNGNLSCDFQAKGDRDEFGAAIHSMLFRLRNLVQDLARKASATAEQSDQLSAASAESSRNAQHIAATMTQVSLATEESARGTDDIARGNQQLASSAQDARQAMDRLQQAMENVHAAGVEQDTVSNSAAQVASRGSEAVGNSMESISRIQQQVELASQSVQDLGAKQAEIGSIVSVIDEIAEQVNLLALNAAIEAARAGEAGRGFAVVADEVRHLAERASAATHEISKLIHAVQDSVVKAVDAANASATEVGEGVRYTEAAQQALGDIQRSVGDVRQAITRNSALISQMMQDGSVVSGAIESVAAVSAESAAAAEELGASTEEIFASAQVVADSIVKQQETVKAVDAMADSLRREAESLQEIVASFKLEEGSEPDEVRRAA